jgi:hypothetical protein
MVSTMQKTGPIASHAPTRDELRAGNELCWFGPAMRVFMSGSRLARIPKFGNFLAQDNLRRHEYKKSIIDQLKSSVPGHDVQSASAKAQGIFEGAFLNPKQRRLPVAVARPQECLLISRAPPARLQHDVPSQPILYDLRQQQYHADASLQGYLLHARTSPMCPSAIDLLVTV